MQELQAVDLQQNRLFDATHCLLCQSMNLSHIIKMKLVKCDLKLISLFNLSIVQTMLLEELTIKGCHGLKHIITDEKDDESHMNYDSILPKLKLLFVEDCNQLMFVIGEYHHEIHDIFPALERLSLRDMPNIKRICQNNDHPRWSALQKLELIECPLFIITVKVDQLLASKVHHFVLFFSIYKSPCCLMFANKFILSLPLETMNCIDI